jgi:hypothetical protein
MNWFERYAVVGGYFSLIMIANLHLNQLIHIPESNNELYAAIFIVSILPIGYILSLLSQFLYYKGLNGIRVHKKILKSLDENYKKKLKISDNDSESELELKMTANLRLSRNSDKIKYLGVFATKRWDILALNSAINLTNIIFWLIFIIIKLYQFLKLNITTVALEEILLLSLTIGISILSYATYGFCTDQIISINKSMREKL